MTVHGDDPTLLADDSALFREPAEETRIERRIEVEGVEDRRKWIVRLSLDMREPVAGENDRVEKIVAERLRKAERSRAQPVVMERQKPNSAAHLPECVDVGLDRCSPALECNAELVGRPCCGDELCFVDSQRLVEGHDVRNGGFADADGSDLIGLDERDGRTFAETAK